jgi:hypothetical protein
MRRLIKYLVIFAAVSILLLVVIINFSVVETRFQCSGKIISKANSTPSTIYMKLGIYRWWVYLWGVDSSGELDVEMPNEDVDHFKIKMAGEQIEIWDYEHHLKGQYSMLSNAISLSTDMGFFEGACKRNY